MSYVIVMGAMVCGSQSICSLHFSIVQHGQ